MGRSVIKVNPDPCLLLALVLYVIVTNTLVFNATRLYLQLCTFPKTGDTPPKWALSQPHREQEVPPPNGGGRSLRYALLRPDSPTPSSPSFPTALVSQILSQKVPYECSDPSGSVPRCFKDKCAGRYKPPRTHHCRSCGVCKMGWDHHVSRFLVHEFSTLTTLSVSLGDSPCSFP